MCVWVHDHIETSCQFLSVIPQVLSSLFWDLSLAWKSFIRPSWLANQLDRVPRHLPVATSLELGLSASHYAMYIYVGSEIEFTSSCFPDNCFPRPYLPISAYCVCTVWNFGFIMSFRRSIIFQYLPLVFLSV